MPFRRVALLLTLALVTLALCACAGRRPQPAPESATRAAGEAPTAADLAPAAAAPEGERYCLRVLFLPSLAQAQDLSERLRSGENFLILARERYKDGETGPSVRCLAAADLEPEVLEAARKLDLGRVSPPLPLGEQAALVMRTTDEYWREGNQLYDAGRYEEAEKVLAKDAALNADGPAWHLLAMARKARKDREGALKALDQALIWSPLDPALINDKASVLLEMGRSDEALALYERALGLSPQSPLLMNNLAWALARQDRDLERAESLAHRATELEPDNASFWDTLGLTQQMAGAHARAAVSYRQALKLSPEMAQAKANLVKSLLALDQESLAELLARPDQKPGRSKRKAQP